MKNNLYRQERLIEKLLKFRWRGLGFWHIDVECYDRFEGDSVKCRVEVLAKVDNQTKRIMKHEAQLTQSFIRDCENKLNGIYLRHEHSNTTN